MGKSTASCFRIITCGGGDGGDVGTGEPMAKDAGDLNSYENKSSGDKRGWSFRKKSGRHRGLNNNAVSENPAATRTRETLESALLKSPSPDNNNVSEKPFTVQSTEDKSQLPGTYVQPTEEKKTQVPVSQAELSVARVEEQVHENTELSVPVESRGTETEDELNETESQVNSKGADGDDGTVMVKDSGSELDIASKLDTQEPETNDVIVIRKENDDKKVDESVIIIIQTAIRGFLARKKLLKHKKAVKLQAAIRGHLVRRQAMGSLRCVQAIVKMQALVRARQSLQHRTCASSISDKADQMSKTNASPASVEKLLQNKFARQLMESAPKTKPIKIKCDPTKPSSAWNWLERWMFVSSPDKTSKPNLSTEEQQSEKIEAVDCPEEIPSHHQFEITRSELETETEKDLSSDEASKIEVCHVEISEAEKVEASTEVDSCLNQSHSYGASEPESGNEHPKNSLKRKVSNPSFIAAQSKFEELTSSTGSNNPMALSYKDVVVGEFKTGRSSSEADRAETQKELTATDDVTQAQLDGGFELGAIHSTLETINTNSETEAVDNGTRFSEKGGLENDEEEITNTEVKDLDVKLDGVKDEAEDLVVSEIQQKAEISTPDAKEKHQEAEAASPMTMSESQATPASQTSSVKAKRDKTQKSGSSQKRKVSKKMSSSPNHESGGAGSVEQEAGKDRKNGRRRNSFGFDQEPKDSSGGKSSLPRFMLPTESARAKVQEYNSPRSSPEVHEKDTSLKKRHSLPGANGKQSSSPRIQRTSSQAQQATKERKWLR